MKLVKMSLAAALLVSGAYALDNVKVNGSAKLIYQTNDIDGAANTGSGILSQGDLASHSAGGAQVLLGATADLVENITAGAEVQVFSTLGLEGNLVNNVMATGSTNDAYNMSQMWMAASLGKTTVKLGRMELDTPMVFTEKWNVAKNTFDAGVVINQDIENTTLVAAWVGKDNGATNGQTASLENGADGGSSAFTQFLTKGAYAAGVINSSVENTTLQAWYFDAPSVAAITWLQADTKLMDMINLGVQYANFDADAAGAKDSDIYAVKVGGSVSDVNLFVAYSSADKDGTSGNFTNLSTGDKTKIYTGTGSIYMDGIVTDAGNDTWKIGASTNVAGYSLAANYTTVDGQAVNTDIDGWDMSVGTKLVGLDLKAIYTAISPDSASGYYGNVDRSTLRIIAGLKF